MTSALMVPFDESCKVSWRIEGTASENMRGKPGA